MWISPLQKGILGETHWVHMISSSVPSTRDLRRSESVRPVKLNTPEFSCSTGRRNSQELTSITDIRGNPPPDKGVNILGDDWSILVLVKYSAAWIHNTHALQIHNTHADSFRNNLWIILISEWGEIKRQTEREKHTLDTDTKILRAYTRSLSHTIKDTLTPHKYGRKMCVCDCECVIAYKTSSRRARQFMVGVPWPDKHVRNRQT